MDEQPVVLERGDGRSGELVLLRRGGELQIVCNGAFVIAGGNERSSRALIAAARPCLPRRPLDVLIGGLGMGYALDEALDLPALRGVTVAEYEPLIVRWFTDHMGERAARAERDARCRIVVADVDDLLTPDARYDLIALDTDNGPQWLLRADNARLYDAGGLRRVARAARRDGVAVFWSPERYGSFEEALAETFGVVSPVPATDLVDGRALEYTMYVCRASLVAEG